MSTKEKIQKAPEQDREENRGENNSDEEGYRKLWWEHWQLPAGLAGVCLALALWLVILNGLNNDHVIEIAALKESIKTGPMQPPANVRALRVKPSRSGPSDSPQISLRLGNPPELIELYIDVSFAKLNTFRVIIERKDQIRAGTVYNLLRDSNGELRLAINTSALYPGTYRLAIEGLVNRGRPVRVGWLTARVTE